MKMFKVGDKVKILSGGYISAGLPNGSCGIISAVRADDLFAIIGSDGCDWHFTGMELELIDAPKFQVGETYTKASGGKVKCIYVSDKGHMFGLQSDGASSAYSWDENGIYQCAVEEDRAPYNIVFPPKVETVTTKGSWAQKGVAMPNHHIYGLQFDLVDGTIDWSTAKVTAV